MYRLLKNLALSLVMSHLAFGCQWHHQCGQTGCGSPPMGMDTEISGCHDCGCSSSAGHSHATGTAGPVPESEIPSSGLPSWRQTADGLTTHSIPQLPHRCQSDRCQYVTPIEFKLTTGGSEGPDSGPSMVSGICKKISLECLAKSANNSPNNRAPGVQLYLMYGVLIL